MFKPVNQKLDTVNYMYMQQGEKPMLRVPKSVTSVGIIKPSEGAMVTYSKKADFLFHMSQEADAAVKNLAKKAASKIH